MSDGRYLALALLIGLASGLLGTGFHLAVDLLRQWPDLLRAGLGTLPALLLAMPIAAAMVLAAFFLVRRVAPEAAGSGVPEVEGALDGVRVVRWRRVLPVKLVGGVLALSSGLVLGREGPTIHIGASLAAAAAEWSRLGDLDRKGLLAAGAAAGLAAAFNAPLAAVLFVIEETRRQFPYSLKSYSGVILAACLAPLVTEGLADAGPSLEIDAGPAPAWLLPAFVLLGLALGAMAVLFNRLLLGMLDGLAALEARGGIVWLPPLLFAAGAGAVTVLLPAASGGGERLILDLAQGPAPPLLLMAVMLVIRFAATLMSYGCGVPGGIFAPLLALATTAGLAFAAMLTVLWPELDAYRLAFAVAAMGGLFTGTVRAPLVATVLVLELTGAFALTVPVLLTAAVANLAADRLGGQPIYEQLLQRTLRLAGHAPAPPRAAGTGIADPDPTR